MNKARGSRFEHGGRSFVRPEQYEEEGNGLPFIGDEPQNSQSKGMNVPEKDITVEEQERILFSQSGGSDRLW